MIAVRIPTPELSMLATDDRSRTILRAPARHLLANVVLKRVPAVQPIEMTTKPCTPGSDRRVSPS